MSEYAKSISLYDDGVGSVAYVDHLGSDLTIVNAARVSFGNEKTELDARDKRLINYLIGHRHTSTLEHNVVTFKFIVPLFVRSQHHRHRTWSYNEISRRYTSIDMELYEPEQFRSQHKSNRQTQQPPKHIELSQEQFRFSGLRFYQINQYSLAKSLESTDIYSSISIYQECLLPSPPGNHL